MSERGYKIDLFEPGDASGVSRLFKEVYGDGYPIKTVYNPEQLVTAFQNGEYIPLLARTPDNIIVGYTALYRSAPHKGLYECGQTLVLPDYRKTPVAGLLFRHTMRVAQKLSGVEALFCEAVCNHTHVQRAGIMFKHVETAIEIDLMPGEAYEKGQTSSGRASTLDMFRTFVQKPHVVYVPDVYEDYSRYVFNGFDDSRTVNVSTDGLPSGGSTEITTQIFDFTQLARLTVYEAGIDFETAFDTEEKRIKASHCTVIQVWLKLSWPWIGAVVHILRNRGYFLGGILPRWFGEDGFLIQKVLMRPNWERINLYTDRAVQILRFIKDDWERTQTGDPR
jgi:hypothetical protein